MIIKNKPKDFYFVAGMPRSGSTLLCNILAQNPRFHTTGTSGVMDVMFGVRNAWDGLTEFKAAPNEAGKMRVLRGILDNYYSDIEKPIVFDKCRGWLSLIEMGEKVLGQKMKIIVPVRDVRDVLASFEKLWRAAAAVSQVRQESQNYFKFQTVQGRTEVWMQADQPVGLAYNRVVDAVQRGYSDRLLLVDFDVMTANPKKVFADIYKFLGEKPFEHNFNNVKQVTWEDDSVHGFKGLHDIRSRVEPMKPQWPTVLGPFAEQYGKLNFWKNKQ
ncbi:TPA: hypothetical protein DCQ44_00230 [Candidatus Taylorbacteria bacterium]|nr:hypothetical protein [Candidatus Taylorbacteria bacterium]